MENSTLKKTISLSSRILFVVVVSFFVFQSCKKDEAVNTDGGYNYFPNNIGHYCIYEVDSTVYNNFQHDTEYYRYQIKEVVESYFTDNEGRQAMRIERYKRPYIDTIPYANLPWTLSRVWTFTRTNTTAEKVEENERFVRLSFVPRVGETWDGNAFNTNGNWQYKYIDVDVPYSINSMSFDSTLLVRQKVDTNLLNYRTYYERYAKHVGMIEKKVIDVSDDNVLPSSVLTRINSGVIYTIKLVSWGN